MVADLLVHVHGAAEGQEDAGDHRAGVPHKHGQVLHVHGHVTLTITSLAEGKPEGGPVDNQSLLFYVDAQLCNRDNSTLGQAAPRADMPNDAA